MNILTHTFKNAPVRIVDQEGNPWFVAKDVCKILGIANSRDAVRDLDEDEKGVVNTDTLGGRQKIVIVSESGLYALIFKSRKAEAKVFRKWVTSEVLPQIRQTGSYDSETHSMTQALTKFVAENFKGRLAINLLKKLKPCGVYGEIAKNGNPKTGFRSPCWVAQRSRQPAATDIFTMFIQLEFFTVENMTVSLPQIKNPRKGLR